MTIDLSKYPENWKEIGRQVRERAGGKCQMCGVSHAATVWRERRSARWTVDEKEARELFGARAYLSHTKLATAHLGIPKDDGSAGDKYDTRDVREANLACYCQRCHFEFDRREIVPRRKATIWRKHRAAAHEAGQLAFIDFDAEAG